MSKIVITTFGSLGDLHPYIAVGLGLKERGHHVVLGTGSCYRQIIESLGLGFHPIRPDSDWLTDADKVRRLSHPRWGLLRVGRELLMPALRESFEDTWAAAQSADLLVAMLATYATRLVAEKAAIPWVSAVHIPMGFFSAHDPPLLDFAPVLSKRLRVLGPTFWKLLFWSGKRSSRFIARPWYRLRSELGLPPTTEGNPLADSQSPLLVLALFSKVIADKQPDWPRQTVITGFPFYDGANQQDLPPELERFLEAGPPPIIFTLGSAVSRNAGQFFEQSVASAKRLKRRAVLIVGKDNLDRLPILSADAIAVEYAPYVKLFPRAMAIVHHGGVGTTGLAMRAGRPMLIVPNAWDQSDNAERAFRLGIARTISKHRFTSEQAALELTRLLDDPAYSQRAFTIGEQIQKETGVATACDTLETLLRNKQA